MRRYFSISGENETATSSNSVPAEARDLSGLRAAALAPSFSSSARSVIAGDRCRKIGEGCVFIVLIASSFVDFNARIHGWWHLHIGELEPFSFYWVAGVVAAVGRWRVRTSVRPITNQITQLSDNSASKPSANDLGAILELVWHASPYFIGFSDGGRSESLWVELNGLLGRVCEDDAVALTPRQVGILNALLTNCLRPTIHLSFVAPKSVVHAVGVVGNSDSVRYLRVIAAKADKSELREAAGASITQIETRLARDGDGLLRMSARPSIEAELLRAHAPEAPNCANLLRASSKELREEA